MKNPEIYRNTSIFDVFTIVVGLLGLINQFTFVECSFFHYVLEQIIISWDILT